MPPGAREKTMATFKAGGIGLLVATTVIEVGVDVPNASLMVIENAERMGLAQLHQLRGRVGRGSEASSCVLLWHAPLSPLAKERLAVLRGTNDGFEVARRDLELRGPGELLGTRQAGLMQLKVADLMRDSDLLPGVQSAADVMMRAHADNIAPLERRWIGALDPLRQGMNGQPAAKSHTHPAPRWTERLDDFTPAAPDAAAAWLREPGLLTERLRACCAGETGLVIVAEAEAPLAAEDAALLGAQGDVAFVREIELTCDGRPWVFAQTLVPQATLARQRWLATLGRAALGERLADVPGIERGPLEYARLAAGDRLYRRALRERRDPPGVAVGAPLLVRDRRPAPPGAGSLPARIARVSSDSGHRPQARSLVQAQVRAACRTRVFPRARQDARRVRAAHAPAPADRHLAAAVAGALGPLDRGRGPAGCADPAGLRRRRGQ